MDRRRFLGALAAGSGLLAGCVAGAPEARDGSGNPGTDPDRPAETAARAGTVTDVPVATLGTPGTICEERTQTDPGTYAITDPAFDGDWSGYDIEGYGPRGSEPLGADWTVIGIEREGRARAYPLAVLWRHEVVNDTFGDPLLVTYCPICRSGVVAERTVDGAVTTFAVTGLLWSAPREFSAAREVEGEVFGATREGGSAEVRHSGNVVLYDDATRSYWSQILAEAICGPATGRTLRVVPSTVATWGEWRRSHPDTEVLLPPPYSGVRRENPPIDHGSDR